LVMLVEVIGPQALVYPAILKQPVCNEQNGVTDRTHRTLWDE
jgi:hypothetical protein